MQLFSDGAKNLMLDALAAVAVFRSLHSAYPGNTGANEIAGGSPAYSREAITWNAAATGTMDDSNTGVFDVPAGTTIAWQGLWSLAAAGTFYGSQPLGATGLAPFTAEADTDVLTADQHGFSDTQQVVVLDATGAVLPTGLVEGTIYFVRDATTDTFKLAATSGGAAIDLTVDGAGFVVRIVPETFGAQGTYTVTDTDLSLNV